jgi:hypothetical protein
LDCEILAGVNEPRFPELSKVRVNDGKNEPYEGYVVARQFEKGRWIYKISIPEKPPSDGTWDNWAPEEWLQPTKGFQTDHLS